MNSSAVRLVSNGNYWQAAYTDLTGRIIRRSLGAKARLTKGGARKKCTALAGELFVMPQRYAPGELPSVQTWAGAYIDSMGQSDSTRKLHQITATMFATCFPNAIRLDKFGHAHAELFRKWLESYTFAKGKAETATRYQLRTNTIRQRLRNARQWLAVAKLRGLIAENPFGLEKCAPVQVAKEWRHIDGPTAETMIAATDEPHAKAMIGLARYAGLRFGEILRLDWADIDLADRTVRVVVPMNSRGERLEDTKHRERLVPVTPRLFELLDAAHLAQSEGRAVVYSSGQAVAAMRGLVKRSGVGVYAKPFHTLRKSCATDWMQTFPVLTVANWLGHAPDVAQEHYVKPTAADYAKASGPITDARDKIIADLEKKILALTLIVDNLCITPKNPQV